MGDNRGKRQLIKIETYWNINVIEVEKESDKGSLKWEYKKFSNIFSKFFKHSNENLQRLKGKVITNIGCTLTPFRDIQYKRGKQILF